MAKSTDETGPVDSVTARLLEIHAENTRRQIEIAERQLEFQKQTLDEDRRVRPRENANHPGISAFSYPEGELKRPKPTLKRLTFHCRVKQNEDLMTPEEIDAFNAFTHNCTSRDGTWTAVVEKNGTTERLLIDHPAKTPDDRMNLPNGLLLILRELREGPEAVDMNNMAARLAQLEAKLAASAA